MRKETSKRGLVIVDTVDSEDEDNKCDLERDLVRYTGPVVFETGEKLSVIAIEIKRDKKEEGSEFFNARIGSIHKRVRRGSDNEDDDIDDDYISRRLATVRIDPDTVATGEKEVG